MDPVQESGSVDLTGSDSPSASTAESSAGRREKKEWEYFSKVTLPRDKQLSLKRNYDASCHGVAVLLRASLRKCQVIYIKPHLCTMHYCKIEFQADSIFGCSWTRAAIRSLFRKV